MALLKTVSHIATDAMDCSISPVSWTSRAMLRQVPRARAPAQRRLADGCAGASTTKIVACGLCVPMIAIFQAERAAQQRRFHS